MAEVMEMLEFEVEAEDFDEEIAKTELEGIEFEDDEGEGIGSDDDGEEEDDIDDEEEEDDE